MSGRIRARSDGAGAPVWAAVSLAWVLAVWAAVSLAWVLLASCASTDDGAIVMPPADDPHGLPSSIVSTSRGPESEATVRVGERVYRFAATCYELGAGDLLVLGLADDPDSELFVEMYLQAFIVDPYIGLRLGDGKLIEAALDAPLDLYVQDDVIRASAVRFVHDLDLTTGEGESAGFGELEVFCSDYSVNPPTSGP